MKEKKRKNWIIFGIIVILAVLITIYYFEVKPVEDLKGFEQVSVEVGPSVVFLVKDCQALPVFVSLEQSVSISDGLLGKRDLRPNSHDLIAEMLKESGIEVLMVKVKELKEGTYYADLVLRKGNKIVKIDCRPSDGIAIAVRMKALVYVKKELLDLGQDICQKKETKDFPQTL